MGTDDRRSSAKTIVAILNLVSFLLFFFGWIDVGDQLRAVIIVCLAVLPVVSIGLMSLPTGTYRFGGLRSTPEASVSLVFIACGTTLFIRAVRDANIVIPPFSRIFVPVLILSLLITAIIVAVDSRSREGIWALVFVFAVLYSYGAVIEANRYLDLAAPKTFEVEVLGKYYESSSRGPTLCYLHVGAWGPFSRPNDVRVLTALYDSTSPGQAVCVSLHGGALGIPWYIAYQCR